METREERGEDPDSAGKAFSSFYKKSAETFTGILLMMLLNIKRAEICKRASRRMNDEHDEEGKKLSGASSALRHEAAEAIRTDDG